MAIDQATPPRGGGVGLDTHGIETSGAVWWNLPVAALYEHAIAAGGGRLARGGALVVSTGAHTGRAPKDIPVVNPCKAANPPSYCNVRN